MIMHVFKKNKIAAALILSAGLSPLLAAAPASAQGIGVTAGVGDHYQRLEINWQSPALWDYQFGGNWGRLELVGELGAAYWKANGSRDPGNVWQFNAIPMFRWWTGERFYLEAGVGATAFTSTRFADKNISTAFQFGDHIGAGFLINDSNRIGLRLSHFSNASIKKPNPGLDVVQLTYTYLY
ncbi:Probable signal peptide protein [plant metagenome]